MLIAQKKNELQQTTSLLEAVGPQQVLSRGYAIVRDPISKKVLRVANQTAAGNTVEVQLHSGQLDCEVTVVRDAMLKEKKSER